MTGQGKEKITFTWFCHLQCWWKMTPCFFKNIRWFCNLKCVNIVSHGVSHGRNVTYNVSVVCRNVYAVVSRLVNVVLCFHSCVSCFLSNTPLTSPSLPVLVCFPACDCLLIAPVPHYPSILGSELCAKFLTYAHSSFSLCITRVLYLHEGI